MIHIVLKSSDRVRSKLPKFEEFLEVYELKVIKRSENKADNTTRLIINARIFPELRWVTNISYDFFEDDVISIQTVYQ
jgi:hypothetical protein